MDLDQGTVVANRYRISRPLGRGGMGEVFAAENIRTGRPVAIKLLRQDSKAKSSAVARFRQEARAAGSINSDHVTQVLDVEEDPEHGVVLVFELLEGESLIDRLKRTGPIAFDELWAIIEQVWMGLADAHRAGIIHRDLKPSNVFLERRPDGTTRVKILDFGISKVPKEVGGETLTEMGQSLGTFSFMPPEQIGKAKTVDHRADIYACATLIYQSLTGQLPYNARNILVMVEMKSKTDARRLGDAMTGPIDPRLDAFVVRGLSRDPSQRFPTALDALEAWRDLRPQGPSSAQPGSGQGISSGGATVGGLGGYPQAAGHGGGHPQAPGHVGGYPQAPIGSAPRPRSQPPPRASGQSSPSFARVTAPAPTPAPAPKIAEGGPLPRLHSDIIEMTTDETAATLAMPMPHLKKGIGMQLTPPLAPRLDSAAASVSTSGSGSFPAVRPPAPSDRSPSPAQPRPAEAPKIASPPTPVGPGGTQPVVIGRTLERLAERGRSNAEPPKPGNLPAHPAGYYIPPAVQASLNRGGPADGQSANAGGTPALPIQVSTPAIPIGASGLPRAYDDSSSQPSGDGDVRTQIYRPEETGKRLHNEPSTEGTAGGKPRPPEPAPLVRPRRGVPLVLVLLGFLLVGFVVVAGAMVLLKGR